MSEVITADLVDLDLKAADRQSASRQLAERLVAAGRVTDIEGFLADIAKRESQMPTGLEGGIGIPHCRSAHVSEPSLAFGRASEGVDFGAPDGPADVSSMVTKRTINWFESATDLSVRWTRGSRSTAWPVWHTGA